jgi:hypothetical protein
MCEGHAARYLSPAGRIKQAYASYKSSTAKRFGAEVEPTSYEEYLAVCFFEDGKRKACNICGERSAGIDRVDKTYRNPATGKLSYLGNCQALCQACNSSKG